MRVGYFGSYVRGDWGVGSDLDVVIVVEHCEQPLERRGLRFDASVLPVPTELFVYTADEWTRLVAEPGFHATVAADAVWLVDRKSPS